jgi:hypothetical protein
MVPGLTQIGHVGIAQAVGATSTTAIPVGGITASHNLLAVIGEKAGVVVTHDTTDFTVGAGTITAGTSDTSSQVLTVIYTDAPAS